VFQALCFAVVFVFSHGAPYAAATVAGARLKAPFYARRIARRL